MNKDYEMELCTQLAEQLDGDVDIGDKKFPDPSVVVGKYRVVCMDSDHNNIARWDIWYSTATWPIKKMLTTDEVVEWIRTN